MRKWIDLLENQWVTAEDIMRHIEQPVIEHGSDFLKDDLDTYGMEELLVWANNIPMQYEPIITIYRGMHLSSSISSYIRWNKVGVSWSPDFKNAINEHGLEGGYGRPQEGSTNVVIIGEVSHDSVDWMATFAISREDGEEPEIRLLRGARVHVKGIASINWANGSEVVTQDMISTDEVSIQAIA